MRAPRFTSLVLSKNNKEDKRLWVVTTAHSGAREVQLKEGAMKKYVDHQIKPKHLPATASLMSAAAAAANWAATACVSALFGGESACQDGLVAFASNGKHWLRK